MAQNGISNLATKEARQVAKLTLAQAKRQANGNTSAPYYRENNVYDINLLPTKYVGNTVVDNAGLLVQGRPWTAGGPPAPSATFTLADGSTFTLADGSTFTFYST